jgi:hypothetical protein
MLRKSQESPRRIPNTGAFPEFAGAYLGRGAAWPAVVVADTERRDIELSAGIPVVLQSDVINTGNAAIGGWCGVPEQLPCDASGHKAIHDAADFSRTNLGPHRLDLRLCDRA